MEFKYNIDSDNFYKYNELQGIKPLSSYVNSYDFFRESKLSFPIINFQFNNESNLLNLGTYGELYNINNLSDINLLDIETSKTITLTFTDGFENKYLITGNDRLNYLNNESVDITLKYGDTLHIINNSSEIVSIKEIINGSISEVTRQQSGENFLIWTPTNPNIQYMYESITNSSNWGNIKFTLISNDVLLKSTNNLILNRDFNIVNNFTFSIWLKTNINSDFFILNDNLLKLSITNKNLLKINDTLNIDIAIDNKTFTYNITANGTTAYVFSLSNDRIKDISGNNSDIVIYEEDTIIFNNNSGGHIIAIKNSNDETIVTESNNSLTYKFTEIGNYTYYCTAGHVNMVGNILVKNNRDFLNNVIINYNQNIIYIYYNGLEVSNLQLENQNKINKITFGLNCYFKNFRLYDTSDINIKNICNLDNIIYIKKIKGTKFYNENQLNHHLNTYIDSNYLFTDIINTQNNITITFWLFKTISQNLIIKINNINIGYINNRIYFNYDNDVNIYNNKLILNQTWHFIALTIENNEIKLYVDNYPYNGFICKNLDISTISIENKLYKNDRIEDLLITEKLDNYLILNEYLSKINNIYNDTIYYNKTILNSQFESSIDKSPIVGYGTPYSYNWQAIDNYYLKIKEPLKLFKTFFNNFELAFIYWKKIETNKKTDDLVIDNNLIISTNEDRTMNCYMNFVEEQHFNLKINEPLDLDKWYMIVANIGINNDHLSLSFGIYDDSIDYSKRTTSIIQPLGRHKSAISLLTNSSNINSKIILGSNLDYYSDFRIYNKFITQQDIFKLNILDQEITSNLYKSDQIGTSQLINNIDKQVISNSIEFNTDMINIFNDFSMTVSFWKKTNKITNEKDFSIISYNNDILKEYVSFNGKKLEIYNSDYNYETPDKIINIDFDKWYNYTFSIKYVNQILETGLYIFDSNNSNIINDYYTDINFIPFSNLIEPTDILIGKSLYEIDLDIDKNIDNFKIFSRWLTHLDIKLIIENDLNILNENNLFDLIVWYRMQDYTDGLFNESLYDYSGNNKHLIKENILVTQLVKEPIIQNVNQFLNEEQFVISNIVSYALSPIISNLSIELSSVPIISNINTDNSKELNNELKPILLDRNSNCYIQFNYDQNLSGYTIEFPDEYTNLNVDLLVLGGGGGGGYSSNLVGSGGGSVGGILHGSNLQLHKNREYKITIGYGGEGGIDGGDSKFYLDDENFALAKGGGKGASYNSPPGQGGGGNVNYPEGGLINNYNTNIGDFITLNSYQNKGNDADLDLKVNYIVFNYTGSSSETVLSYFDTSDSIVRWIFSDGVIISTGKDGINAKNLNFYWDDTTNYLTGYSTYDESSDMWFLYKNNASFYSYNLNGTTYNKHFYLNKKETSIELTTIAFKSRNMNSDPEANRQNLPNHFKIFGTNFDTNEITMNNINTNNWTELVEIKFKNGFEYVSLNKNGIHNLGTSYVNVPYTDIDINNNFDIYNWTTTNQTFNTFLFMVIDNLSDEDRIYVAQLIFRGTNTIVLDSMAGDGSSSDLIYLTPPLITPPLNFKGGIGKSYTNTTSFINADDNTGNGGSGNGGKGGSGTVIIKFKNKLNFINKLNDELKPILYDENSNCYIQFNYDLYLSSYTIEFPDEFINLNVDLLVLGGGGGGGYSSNLVGSGGGSVGGILHSSNLQLHKNREYKITIGYGGEGGIDGGDSKFYLDDENFALAKGGGKGASYNSPPGQGGGANINYPEGGLINNYNSNIGDFITLNSYQNKGNDVTYIYEPLALKVSGNYSESNLIYWYGYSTEYTVKRFIYDDDNNSVVISSHNYYGIYNGTVPSNHNYTWDSDGWLLSYAPTDLNKRMHMHNISTAAYNVAYIIINSNTYRFRPFYVFRQNQKLNLDKVAYKTHMIDAFKIFGTNFDKTDITKTDLDSATWTELVNVDYNQNPNFYYNISLSKNGNFNWIYDYESGPPNRYTSSDIPNYFHESYNWTDTEEKFNTFLVLITESSSDSKIYQIGFGCRAPIGSIASDGSSSDLIYLSPPLKYFPLPLNFKGGIGKSYNDTTSFTNADDNTGNGGSGNGGKGGSGTVIIKYKADKISYKKELSNQKELVYYNFSNIIQFNLNFNIYAYTIEFLEDLNIDLLVLAGGGGGGGGYSLNFVGSGGGSVGGILHSPNLQLPKNREYKITIGYGGKGGTDGIDTKIYFDDENFALARGGGKGGSYNSPPGQGGGATINYPEGGLINNYNSNIGDFITLNSYQNKGNDLVIIKTLITPYMSGNPPDNVWDEETGRYGNITGFVWYDPLSYVYSSHNYNPTYDFYNPGYNENYSGSKIIDHDYIWDTDGWLLSYNEDVENKNNPWTCYWNYNDESYPITINGTQYSTPFYLFYSYKTNQTNFDTLSYDNHGWKISIELTLFAFAGNVTGFRIFGLQSDLSSFSFGNISTYDWTELLYIDKKTSSIQTSVSKNGNFNIVDSNGNHKYTSSDIDNHFNEYNWNNTTERFDIFIFIQTKFSAHPSLMYQIAFGYLELRSSNDSGGDGSSSDLIYLTPPLNFKGGIGKSYTDSFTNADDNTGNGGSGNGGKGGSGTVIIKYFPNYSYIYTSNSEIKPISFDTHSDYNYIQFNNLLYNSLNYSSNLDIYSAMYNIKFFNDFDLEILIAGSYYLDDNGIRNTGNFIYSKIKVYSDIEYRINIDYLLGTEKSKSISSFNDIFSIPEDKLLNFSNFKYLNNNGFEIDVELNCNILNDNLKYQIDNNISLYSAFPFKNIGYYDYWTNNVYFGNSDYFTNIQQLKRPLNYYAETKAYAVGYNNNFKMGNLENNTSHDNLTYLFAESKINVISMIKKNSYTYYLTSSSLTNQGTLYVSGAVDAILGIGPSELTDVKVTKAKFRNENLEEINAPFIVKIYGNKENNKPVVVLDSDGNIYMSSGLKIPIPSGSTTIYEHVRIYSTIYDENPYFTLISPIFKKFNIVDVIIGIDLYLVFIDNKGSVYVLGPNNNRGYYGVDPTKNTHYLNENSLSDNEVLKFYEYNSTYNRMDEIIPKPYIIKAFTDSSANGVIYLDNNGNIYACNNLWYDTTYMITKLLYFPSVSQSTLPTKFKDFKYKKPNDSNTYSLDSIKVKDVVLHERMVGILDEDGNVYISGFQGAMLKGSQLEYPILQQDWAHFNLSSSQFETIYYDTPLNRPKIVKLGFYYERMALFLDNNGYLYYWTNGYSYFDFNESDLLSPSSSAGLKHNWSFNWYVPLKLEFKLGKVIDFYNYYDNITLIFLDNIKKYNTDFGNGSVILKYNKTAEVIGSAFYSEINYSPYNNIYPLLDKNNLVSNIADKNVSIDINLNSEIFTILMKINIKSDEIYRIFDIKNIIIKMDKNFIYINDDNTSLSENISNFNIESKWIDICITYINNNLILYLGLNGKIIKIIETIKTLNTSIDNLILFNNKDLIFNNFNILCEDIRVYSSVLLTDKIQKYISGNKKLYIE